VGDLADFWLFGSQEFNAEGLEETDAKQALKSQSFSAWVYLELAAFCDALSWIDLKPSTLTRDLKQWLGLDVNSNDRLRLDETQRGTRRMKKSSRGSA